MHFIFVLYISLTIWRTSYMCYIVDAIEWKKDSKLRSYVAFCLQVFWWAERVPYIYLLVDSVITNVVYCSYDNKCTMSKFQPRFDCSMVNGNKGWYQITREITLLCLLCWRTNYYKDQRINALEICWRKSQRNNYGLVAYKQDYSYNIWWTSLSSLKPSFQIWYI